jgi:uncharacterized protein HemY
MEDDTLRLMHQVRVRVRVRVRVAVVVVVVDVVIVVALVIGVVLNISSRCAQWQERASHWRMSHEATTPNAYGAGGCIEGAP